MVTSVRLLNEDKRQIILEANQSEKDYDYQSEPSKVTNQALYSGKSKNKAIEIIEVDKTSRRTNDPINNSQSLTELNTKEGNVNLSADAVVPRQLEITNADNQANPEPESQPSKNTVPCPFLFRRGHCVGKKL